MWVAVVALLLSAYAFGSSGEDAWKKLLSLAGEWEGGEARITSTLTRSSWKP
jgi:hypothetical protein